MLEVADDESYREPLLAEVARFLTRRGLQRFAGLNPEIVEITRSGKFYGREYFSFEGARSLTDVKGNFYGA